MEKESVELKNEKEIKLFDKYSFIDVVVNDPGLKNIISLKPFIVPKTSGRLSQQRLGRERMSIVERLITHLMIPGHKGKKHLRTSKLMSGRFYTASNLVNNAFDRISKDGLNPIQVLVKAVENSAPREEVMTLLIGGQRIAKQVDTAPIRRVDLALRWIAEGTYQLSATGKKADQALYEILEQSAKNQDIAFPISKKIDTERQASSSR
ncbi:MAG: Ribosomal protein S7 [Candidatus Parvarchaeum acidophilus ARMAN-5_'5-way FS']|jgi:small subunit ribosomal protein S7|uniref:Ribosomal protein S7 n=1 Tax=Candidatus Parvarchaeum acidophilus ARMAN-5_'5-way FS' TaxID=994838 RepID=F2UU02_PARA5|nr:MAG: Ribosomal protein S7 [Candidatus Parvarchaeum acidophilus ARMAN-5_'5-way FS']